MNGGDPMPHPSPLIVDAHVHVFPEEIQRARERFCARDRGFGSVYGNPKARMVTAEQVIQALDESGIYGAVVFGFPWSDLALCQLHNDYLMDISTAWATRLVGLGCVSPVLGEPAVTEAERCLQGGLGGIGEVATYGEADVAMESPFFGDLADLLKKWERPLVLHATESVGHDYPGKDHTDLASLYRWIAAHPDLDVVLAHWGGGLFFYELMPEVREACSRVFYDTAASPFLYRAEIYDIALRIVGVERILLGSDFPLIHPRRYLREIGGLGLSEERIRGLLGGNATRLFGWKGPD
jgi:uncharacterized protein